MIDFAYLLHWNSIKFEFNSVFNYSIEAHEIITACLYLHGTHWTNKADLSVIQPCQLSWSQMHVTEYSQT